MPEVVKRCVQFASIEGWTEPEEIDHELKVWPDQFVGLSSGDKKHEYRYNDRDFKIDDLVLLREFELPGDRYLGGQVLARITWISYGPEWGITDGFCAFSIRGYFGGWRFES